MIDVLYGNPTHAWNLNIGTTTYYRAPWTKKKNIMKYYRGYEVSLLDSASNKINHCIIPSFLKCAFQLPISCLLELNIIQFRMRSITLFIWKLAHSQLLSYSEFPFNVILQKLWAPWEMHLWPVGWSTVLTPIVEKQPSTLHTTPRLENSGTPTFSSPISTTTTPWWPTTPMKECCTPGTTIVWSLILSLLRNTRLITWSSGVGLENTLIRDAFLWYKDDEETGQFTVENKLVNRDSKSKKSNQSNKLTSIFDRTPTLQNLTTLSCF